MESVALGAPDVRRRVAAARALGRVGTVSAVPELRRAEEDPGLRRAAREAVALIHGRASGAAPGQLSLAGDASGRVSLAQQPEGGELSLPTQEGDV